MSYAGAFNAASVVAVEYRDLKISVMCMTDDDVSYHSHVSQG